MIRLFACLLLLALPSSLLAQEDLPFYNRRPYLQSLTSTSVRIVSQSKDELIARLSYGLTETMDLGMEEATAGHDHEFYLEGLLPNTVYHYQVTHVDADLFPGAALTTLPEPGSEVRIGAIGDSGSLSDAQVEIASMLVDFDPLILLHTGDTVYPYGSPSNYQEKFFSVYERLLTTCCVYPSLGNHDCFLSPDYWLYMFHLPANNPSRDESYYSFDAGDAHLAALNTCNESLPPEQIRWLEENLSASTRAWKIVYLHQPLYSNGEHGGNVPVREALLPVVDKLHVDLVVSGHDHVYERSYPIFERYIRDGFQDPVYRSPRGTIYVVTGGGGSALYDYIPGPDAHMSAVFHSKHHYFALRITATQLEGKAVGLGNSVIDTFRILKEPVKPVFQFVRGDANEDGEINLADAIAILEHLFTGGSPPCIPASDTDASGEILVSDPIRILRFLFLGGDPPHPPFPACGPAPGEEDTGCTRSCG